MAWFVRPQYRDSATGTFWSPQIEEIPEDHERFDSIAQSVGKAIEARWMEAGRDRDSALYPLIYTMSFAASLNQGWRFPEPDAPFRDRLKKPLTEELIDIVDTSFGSYAISDKVIDMIEAIEPGVHQYLPYQLLRRDGSVVKEPRWLLNICTRAEAIDTGRSNVVWSPNCLPRTFADVTAGGGQPRIVVKQEEASHRALWWEWRYRTAKGFMVGDRLWAMLQAAGIRGWSTDFTNRDHMEEL